MGSVNSREEAEREFRSTLEDTFRESVFPVEDPFELIPLLPDGKDTVFSVGRINIPPKDLGLKYSEYQDYPYDTREKLISDIIERVKKEGDLYREKTEYSSSVTIELPNNDNESNQ